MGILERETAKTEQSLLGAARNSAQAVYANGVFIGAGILAVLSLLLGLGLLIGGQKASVGIALPAGGLGAVTSVMQRLHSGSLEVDYQAPASRVRMFGAFRPIIGGIFAMVIFGILEAGQFSALSIPTGTGPEFAFIAILGFVSGFNERFANDIVSQQAGSLEVGR